MAIFTGNFKANSLLRSGVAVLALCAVLYSVLVLRAGMSTEHRDSPQLANQITTFSAEAMRKTIVQAQQFGNRTTGEKQWQTAHWLENSFREMGIAVAIHTYEYKGMTWPNVVAEMRGSSIADQKILVLAHLDSITSSTKSQGAPGADDNGSGMAVLLELARNLKNIPLDRTVMFCIFSNEEQGHKGSSAFARAQRQEGADIRAVINLDTLGYNRPSNLIYFSALKSIASWEIKYKAARTMLVNYVKGLHYGNNSITVAGRPKHARLVTVTAATLANTPELRVRARVKDDCG